MGWLLSSLCPSRVNEPMINNRNIFLGFLLGLVAVGVGLHVTGAEKPKDAPPTSTSVTSVREWQRATAVVPLNDTNQVSKTVIARGVAPIVNGDEKRARQNALRDAYRTAICQAGVEVGHLTEMRNFKELVDVVVTRSVGMVKKYKIIFEGTTTNHPPNFEIMIEAEVGSGTRGDLMALALFLEVIQRPKVLLLLQENEAQTGVSTTPATPNLAEDNAEIVLAKYFHDAGYEVMTSKDALGSTEEQARKLTLAKQGYTEPARELGRQYGADVVLCGTVRIKSQSVTAYNIALQKVHLTCTARVVVTGSGQALAMEDSSHQSSAELYEAARDKSVRSLAKDVGEKLVWKIPEALASQPQLTTVLLQDCTLQELKTVNAALASVAGVETVRTGGWSRGGNGETGRVVFTVVTGFLGAYTEDLWSALQTLPRLKLRADTLQRYNLELSVKRDGSS